MLSLSYTVSPRLKETLYQIDQVHVKILLYPLSPKNQLRHRWETTIDRLHSASVIEKFPLSKSKIEKVLTHNSPTPESRLISGYKAAFDLIEQNYLVNPKPVGKELLKTIWETTFPKSPRAFKSLEPDLKSLTEYLNSQAEHPIIESSIAFAQSLLVQKQLLESDSFLFPTLLGYLYLYRKGYDVRGFLSLETCWQANFEKLQQVVQTTAAYGGLSPWLDFATNAFLDALLGISASLHSSHFDSSLRSGFFLLNSRQKQILTSLENPDTSVSNKDVQRQFRVSQITASRDLSKLKLLGLVISHGNGRSLTYTRV